MGWMGWWLSVSGWIYFDLSFTGTLFYHVFLTVSIKTASVNPFMSLFYIISVRMRIKAVESTSQSVYMKSRYGLQRTEDCSTDVSSSIAIKVTV